MLYTCVYFTLYFLNITCHIAAEPVLEHLVPSIGLLNNRSTQQHVNHTWRAVRSMDGAAPGSKSRFLAWLCASVFVWFVQVMIIGVTQRSLADREGESRANHPKLTWQV